MEIGHWITVGIFVLTNIGLWAGVIISIRIDMRAFKIEIKSLQEQMKKFGNILVTLADFKGEMNLIQERLAMQGKRLDDTITMNNAKELRYEAQLDKLKEAVESRRS